jgi:hypothetical protein
LLQTFFHRERGKVEKGGRQRPKDERERERERKRERERELYLFRMNRVLPL